MDGADERVVPGNALTVSPNLPYRGLDRFGVSFLNKFEASQLPSPVLRNITIVDTPGKRKMRRRVPWPYRGDIGCDACVDGGIGVV